ncbi:serine/threonine-protein kinase [Nocardiopsis sp. FIRDI 009]|uniref:serine/threonine protein kinase n=1 Tax=Nocardiopsis sp. FIRDI 009 TaxID=714197 RepID=UPI000E22B76A|nr:serine/threonine-protein kinase [Nocardiopsis sp. FIRDI 009]
MNDPQHRAGPGAERDPDGRVVGDFRLVRSLGRGGFGEVFLGEAPDGTRAAVKVLHASWAGDAEMRRRFTAEVEQARRVSGFCIAAILDADPEAEEPWIATEFIDGPTLHDAVAQDGPRSGAELHRLAVSTATALAAIHAAGVVHRDLKPENIMLAPDGPRVIDFGIAKAVESTSVTASGVIGTIGYMAPEQLEGARLTSAVDIFAWGSVMVYAATGREAFPGPTQAARIARILSAEPELGTLPGALRDIVRTCLDKDATRRPDATTLLNRLIAAPPDGPRTAPPPPVAGTAPVQADARTRVERPVPVDPTRVERPVEETRVETAGGTDSTRVRPPATVGPTRAYTRVAPAAPPPGTGPATGTPYPPSAPLRDGVPPYHFVGVRFTDARSLATAMQQNWNAAVRVFSDPQERAALGAWIMDDLGDTSVDRSLFRRRVDDANLAIASFIAQLCPELPPVFRGRGATPAELGDLFNDPRPLFTGAPLANEMALLARPEVLRVMDAHRTDEPGRLRQLADHLEEAERAGIAFHRQLVDQLAGWKASRAEANPALILTFLLHPERMVRPATGDDSELSAWVEVLWTRVEGSPLPLNAGCAAVVYGTLPTMRALAAQRRDWEGRFHDARAKHDALADRVGFQLRLYNTMRYCRYAAFGFPIGLGIAFVESRITTDFIIPLFVINLMIWVGLLGLIGAAVSGSVLRVACGGPPHRARRAWELQQSGAQLPQLSAGVERIRDDLRRAREICGA